MNFST